MSKVAAAASKSSELRPLTTAVDGKDDEEAAAPRAEAAKPRVVARLLSYAAEDRALVGCGAAAVLVSSAFDTLLPNFSARALALVVSPQASGRGGAWEPRTFRGALLGLITCALSGAATTGARVWCTALVEVRLVARVQVRATSGMTPRRVRASAARCAA